MGRKPPPAIPLSRERILAAAMVIADREGTNALSMRKIAAALDVKAMSLYNHVANKEAILDGLVDLVVDAIDVPKPGIAWREGMRRRAISARDVLKRHRWAIGLIDSRANPGPASLRYHDALLGVLLADGFSEAMAVHTVSALDAYIYGFCLQEQSLPFDAEGGDEAMAMTESIAASFDGSTFPHLHRVATELVNRPGYRYADEFEFGLDLLLDGVERRIAQS